MNKEINTDKLSAGRLRTDTIWISTQWSFNNFSSRVQIILIVSVTKSRVMLEKWQLLPPEASAKITRQYITSLGQQTLHMPPLVSQVAVDQ